MCLVHCCDCRLHTCPNDKKEKKERSSFAPLVQFIWAFVNATLRPPWRISRRVLSHWDRFGRPNRTLGTSVIRLGQCGRGSRTWVCTKTVVLNPPP